MSQTFSKVATNLPGENAKQLLDRRHRAIPKGVSYGIPPFADTAEGPIVKDVDGNTLIDVVGAIGTINVGHSHPKVKEALHKQVDRFIHTGFNVMMYESYVELAERLAAIAPGEFDKKVLLLNSGAEAVENAVKIARKYTKRQGIISFNRGFHGRTLMTMTMTSKVKPYKYEFGPFAPEDFMITEFKNFLNTEVAPETIAAVVMEPIQGEGGFIVPGKRFVQEVYQLCKEHGILFVSDEIQAGFARTGRYFGIEHFDVEPDLITVSKSLGAGVPISGVIGRAEIMDESNPGELGGTYCGSPLGCEAALAVLDIIEEEKLNERGEYLGKVVTSRFEKLAEKYDCIGDIRGLGAMSAIELVKDRETKEADKELTQRIVKEANKRGLLLLSAGVFGNVLRILMPIVITDEQLEEGLAIFEAALEASVQQTVEV